MARRKAVQQQRSSRWISLQLFMDFCGIASWPRKRKLLRWIDMHCVYHRTKHDFDTNADSFSTARIRKQETGRANSVSNAISRCFSIARAPPRKRAKVRSMYSSCWFTGPQTLTWHSKSKFNLRILGWISFLFTAPWSMIEQGILDIYDRCSAVVISTWKYGFEKFYFLRFKYFSFMRRMNCSAP